MFSIDIFKSYKPKIKNKHFEVLMNKAFSWKSKFEWLYYYIDKSSLVFSEDRKKCQFKIEFFKKEQLISEIHFAIDTDRKFWSSLTDNLLNFILEVVDRLCFLCEKLWVYIVPESINSSYYGFSSWDIRFENFKVFDEDFNLLYEVKDIRVEIDSYDNIETSKGKNNRVKSLITKEWLFCWGVDLLLIKEETNYNDEIDYSDYFTPFETRYYSNCIDFKETIFFKEDDYIKLETWKNSLFEKLYNFLLEKKFLFYEIWEDTKLVYEEKFGFTLILEFSLRKLEEYWEKKFFEWMKELGWNFVKRKDKYLYFNIWYSKYLWTFFDISQYKEIKHIEGNEYLVLTENGEKDWKLMENWTMIFEYKSGKDESSKKEDKKIIHSSYSKLFPKEIARVKEKIIRIISKKSYIKTQWIKWLKKIYLELTRIKLEDFENELIYFTNNDLKYRKSFLFTLTNSLLDKKTFVVKHSYHNMLIQDNWKFNYIF